MIEDAAIDGLCRAGEAAGGTHVAFTRCRVAARMVVSEHDAAASVQSDILHDRPQWKIHACVVAVVTAEVQAIEPVVDMRDPQALHPRVGLGYAAGKECPGRGKVLQLERKFGTLISHAARLKDFGLANDWN